MPNPASSRPRLGPLASPPVVAVAGWLLPGAGYWLIGERARALAAGVTIIALFVLGILIGGVRVIQVPGYSENGERLYSWQEWRRTQKDQEVPTGVVKIAEEEPAGNYKLVSWVAKDPRALLRDVANKPWSICQVLAGPVALAGGAWSVSASRPIEQPDGAVAPTGVLSHSRINEIAVLYTAVAGMLNLMVIIDAAARAGQQPASAPDFTSTGRCGFNTRPEAA